MAPLSNYITNKANIVDMMCILDPEGNFIFVNEPTSIMLGTAVKDLYSKSFHEFIRSDYLDRTIKFYKHQVNNNDLSSYYELPIINSLNEEIWIGQTVETVYDKNGIVEFKVLARDITERLVSENRYKDIIQNLDLGLIEVDMSERIVFINDSFCRNTGYAKNELIDRMVTDVFMELDEPDRRVVESQKHKRSKGISSVYEIKYKKKNGEEAWMMISATPLKNSLGEIAGSMSICQDITKRTRVEEQKQELIDELARRNADLHLKQGYLKAINNFSKRIIESISIDEIIHEITENVIHKFGFTDCVVYLIDESKTALEQVAAYGPKNDDGEVLNPLTIKIGDGIVGNVALSGQAEIVNDTSKDPRYIVDDTVRLSELAVPIIADDEIIGVIDSENEAAGFFTEEHLETLQTIANLASTKIRNAIMRLSQAKADATLRENEKKMLLVLDSVLDAVITIDDHGTVTEWNAQAVEIFEFTKEEAVGQKLTEMIIPERFRSAYEKGISRFRKSGDARVLNKRTEMPGMNKYGNELAIELSTVPVKMKGRFFFSVFARDITLRKQAELDMQEALNKQQEINDMKSRFVTITSHEFRTPLTTIQSNIDLLEIRLVQEKLMHNKKYQKNFSRISSEIKRLTSLMNDILLIGKIESGKMLYKPVSFSMAELCKEIIEEFYLKNNKVSIRFDTVGQERNSYLDPNTYRHIITNLIANSHKYSPQTKGIYVNLIFEDDYIKIVIKDDGIGIPKNEQDKLFDSFFRASNVENIPGTGLGLVIAKEFIDKNGGTISVESEVNKGSTFTIRQPDQPDN